MSDPQVQESWSRSDFASWDQAFRALSPVIQQQSVRVAEYTRVLFTAACGSAFAEKTPEAARRIKGQHADVAYRCGLYHQLGKALVPPQYQVEERDFSPEERAVYRKYTADGRLLAASLQEKASVSGRLRRKVVGSARPERESFTRNIVWLMEREACQQHMERYDGSGYPQGLKGEEISPIAQLVGLARELDRLASGIKSEAPFDAALTELREQSGKGFSPELLAVLTDCVQECRTIYTKYIHYSRTLPATVPLVAKTQDRPMGLAYFPLVELPGSPPLAYEAFPWFKGNPDNPQQRQGLQQLEELVKKGKLTLDLSFYFLYEAADTLFRLQNCKIPCQGIVLHIFPGFFTQPSQLKGLEELYQRQELDKSKLLLSVPAELVASMSKTAQGILARYLRNGVSLLLDGYRPELLSLDKLRELGFVHIRLDSRLNDTQQGEELLSLFQGAGLVIWGGGADTAELAKWLYAHGAACSGGSLAGAELQEEELIRNSLARENCP